MNSVIAAKSPQKPIDLIRTQLYLPAMREQLKAALPPSVTVEKFLRVAMTALQQNPKLADMDRNSLFAAIVSSAQLGLLPDAQLGEAYFVPFKGKVTLVPGYRGLIKLARQGDIGYVEAELIHQNDKTTFVLGDDSRLECIVNWEDRGPIKAAYAVAKWRDGGMAARVVMSKAEIDAVRAQSQAATGPAWSNNYAEMAKKSALRKLAKLLPLATTASNAFRLSELHEELAKPGRIIEGQVIEDEAEELPAEAPVASHKRRRTALDSIGSATDSPVGDDPQAADSARGAMNVDPDTGEILERGDGSSPTTNP